MGWTLLALPVLYLFPVAVWSDLYPKERFTLMTAVIGLGFYISLRVLLRAGRPGDRLIPCLLFVGHLINLLVLILVSAFGLLGLRPGYW